nr:ribonuclease H-like domain-containing protein [Tanacetum cinerariifolium]
QAAASWFGIEMEWIALEHELVCYIHYNLLDDALGFPDSSIPTRCDSTGDFYPVMKPSTIPHAFLTNQHTWHQRLGYLGSGVLCHVLSSNPISCNKEKPPVLCHAC